MKIKNQGIVLLLFWLLLLTFSSFNCLEFANASSNTESRRKMEGKINNYIHSLDYDVRDILTQVYVESPQLHTTTFNDGDDFVIQKRKLENFNKTIEAMYLQGPLASNIFPGSLLYGNHKIFSADPTTVKLANVAKLTYTVSLPDVNQSLTVYANYGNFSAALTSLLNSYYKKFSATYSVPSDSYDKCHHIETNTNFQFKFGGGLELIKLFKIGDDIDFTIDPKKTIWICELHQIFFNVSIPKVYEPADLFDLDHGIQDLHCTFSDKKPPVVVDTVTYGRLAYIKIEHEFKKMSEKVGAEYKDSVLSFWTEKEYVPVYKSDTVELKTNYRTFKRHSQMSMILIGVGSSGFQSISDSKRIHDFVFKIGEFSSFGKSKPGALISYTAKFVKEGFPIHIERFGSYSKTTPEVYTLKQHIFYRCEEYPWKMFLFGVCYKFEDSIWKKEEYSWPDNGERKVLTFQNILAVEFNCFFHNVTILYRYGAFESTTTWETVYDENTEYDSILNIGIKNEKSVRHPFNFKSRGELICDDSMPGSLSCPKPQTRTPYEEIC